MSMQYMVVALTCLSLHLQAARMRSQASLVPPTKFVSALKLHPSAGPGRRIGRAANETPEPEMRRWQPAEPLDAEEPAEPLVVEEPAPPLNVEEPAEPSEYEVEMATWTEKQIRKGRRGQPADALHEYIKNKTEDKPVDVAKERLAMLKAVQELVQQPPMKWDLHDCLGRGAMIPKKDYEFKANGQTSTSDGRFEIMESGIRDLWLRTPWKLSSMSRILIEGENTEDPNIKRHPSWTRLMRQECCGMHAALLIENVGGELTPTPIHARIQCLGAGPGDRCRISNSFTSLFVREPCREGYECRESKTSEVTNTLTTIGVGDCQPVLTE